MKGILPCLSVLSGYHTLSAHCWGLDSVGLSPGGVVENTDGGSLLWGACKMRHSGEHARMEEMCHSQVPERLGAKGKLVRIPEVACDSASE